MTTTDTLRPGYYLYEEVEAPDRHKVVSVEFVAEDPVNVYAMSRPNFLKFKREEEDEIRCYASSEGKARGTLLFTPVAGSVWYLVIQNESDEKVGVSYDLEI